jgi:hypothetical protein
MTGATWYSLTVTLENTGPNFARHFNGGAQLLRPSLKQRSWIRTVSTP